MNSPYLRGPLGRASVRICVAVLIVAGGCDRDTEQTSCSLGLGLARMGSTLESVRAELKLARDPAKVRDALEFRGSFSILGGRCEISLEQRVARRLRLRLRSNTSPVRFDVVEHFTYDEPGTNGIVYVTRTIEILGRGNEVGPGYRVNVSITIQNESAVVEARPVWLQGRVTLGGTKYLVAIRDRDLSGTFENLRTIELAVDRDGDGGIDAMQGSGEYYEAHRPFDLGNGDFELVSISRNGGRAIFGPSSSDAKVRPFLGRGAKAPPLRGVDLAGKEFSLDQYAGKRVLLVFWASW